MKSARVPALLLAGLMLAAQPATADDLTGLTDLTLPAAKPDAAFSDEFAGPFDHWLNIKRDFDAAGDGETDDTKAIQTALDAIQPRTRTNSTLYLPAGTYRITETLRLGREGHGGGDAQGIMIVGEHPDKTLLVWDGKKGAAMLHYSGWYSRIGRLTFDGAGVAGSAIDHFGPFSTWNEYFDIYFKDVGFGIRAGDSAGIAETAVHRARFIRCSQAGISIQDWNTLDWWIWHSYFEDCRVGVTNVYKAGHFHVYESVFVRSGEADMTMGNTQYFSIRNNTSVDSNAFFVARPMGAGAQITLQGNTILRPRGGAPVRVGNVGPLLMLDNTIESAGGDTAVQLGQATRFVSLGNRYVSQMPVRGGGYVINVEDALPVLPGPAPLVERRVIAVKRGASSREIQAAINQADEFRGERPIVLLPMGAYRIADTIRLPAYADMQLVGDSSFFTRLQWTGAGAGPVIKIEGPTRATLRSMIILAGRDAAGIVAENVDQPGGRVYGNQIAFSGHRTGEGLRVDRLTHTQTHLYNIDHSGNEVAVNVIGPGEPIRGAGGRVIIFSGASSSNLLSYRVTEGGWLMARDIWYETNEFERFAELSDTGTFTMHGALAAFPRSAEEPGVLIDDFRGRVTLAAVNFNAIRDTSEHPAMVVTGNGAETELLLLGTHGSGEYFENRSPEARAARIASVQYPPEGGGGAIPIDDAGEWDDGFIRRMIEPIRQVRQPVPLAPVPHGSTDLRFLRVRIQAGQGSLLLFSGERKN